MTARLTPLAMVSLLALATGCASLPTIDATSWLGASQAAFEREAELSPAGPGAVFATPEAAAMDALAYSYLRSRGEVASRRAARGGAIRAADGGFTYDEPAVAPRRTRSRVEYRLAPTDVAHFQHHPTRSAAGTASSPLRTLDVSVRETVESNDPAQRPLYYLTPDRFVRAYEAGQDDVRSLARVRFGTRHDATSLALQLPESGLGASDAGLALVPTVR